MSIKKLEEIKDKFIDRENRTDNFLAEDMEDIASFIILIVDTFKDQSDMIADLQKQLDEKMKRDDQKESYYPKKEVRL